MSVSQIIKNKGDQYSLYLGNIIFATNLQYIEKYQIKAVVSVTSENQCPKYPQHISQLKILAQDDTQQNLYKQFQQTFQFIQKNLKLGNVLVHCIQGISRSATLVISYLMRKDLITFNRAYQLLKSKRYQIHPNYGFIQQLKDYNKVILQLKQLRNKDWYT